MGQARRLRLEALTRPGHPQGRPPKVADLVDAGAAWKLTQIQLALRAPRARQAARRQTLSRNRPVLRIEIEIGVLRDSAA